jgi:hypothetical protein
MNRDVVEAVTQAFYNTETSSRGWDREPELLKERYRRDARAALAMLDLDRTGKKILEKVAKLHLLLAGFPWFTITSEAIALA